MTELDAELAQTRQNILNLIHLISTEQLDHHQQATGLTQNLTDQIRQYFDKISGVMQQSSDFEKELAFELLRRAENDHLSGINILLQNLKRHEFEDIASSRGALMSAASSNLVKTIAIGLGGGGLMLTIAYIVIRRITQRLSLLLSWSREVSAGNLSAPLTDESRDEVGRVTHAMEEMSQNIQRAHGELAQAKEEAEDVAEKLRIYANAFENSGEAIIISDDQNNILNVNKAFIAQTGFTREEVIGRNPRFLASGRTPKSTYHEMWKGLNEESFWHGELWDRKKSGEIYPNWVAISAIRNNIGEVIFYIASFTDVSERKEAEARIEHLAHHDILTGLQNRFSLEDRLEQSLSIARRNRHQVAVLFIDLDHFKNINDSLGHQFGDQLLVKVANRLKACVRESDIVARIGGDEFVVVLTDMNDSSDAAHIAENLQQQLALPYEIDGSVLESTPSIGISIFPDDSDCSDDCNCADELMRNADVAMYHAKEHGRNNYYFYTESMLVAAHERLRIEREFRAALEQGHLELHYQPQVSAIDNRICAMEALVRWRHPEQGLIPPARFIPIAEESGSIQALGEWVFDEACRQLASWKSEGINSVRMTINLSAKQLHSDTLTDLVKTSMLKHGVQGNELEFEITETAAMNDPQMAVTQLNALRDLGIWLAIDDFGTGYSSLAYMKRLPIQTLKLDRTFVRDIESDPNDAEISLATIALAHNLGLKVVAEGVETDAQRAFLSLHNCDYLQGYLFSKPLPSKEASKLLGDRLYLSLDQQGSEHWDIKG
jgi:diguanylate cyclase (GGDEF)-like protein/PAS domain S-box-containing protein